MFDPQSAVKVQSVLHMVGLQQRWVMNIHEEWVWSHMDWRVGRANSVPAYVG